MKKNAKVISIVSVSLFIVLITGFYYQYNKDINLSAHVDKSIAAEQGDTSIFEKYKNAKNIGKLKENFAVLFSSPFLEGGEVKISKKGTFSYKIPLEKTRGLGGIKQYHNELWINGTEDKALYSIDLDTKEVVNKEAKNFTNFMGVNGEDKIIVYKEKDVNYNRLVVERPNKKNISKRLRGFLRIAETDSKYVYAFADLVDKNESSALYVLDKKNGDLVKKLNMPYKYADDIEFFQGKVLLTTKEKITIINPDNWDISFQQALTLPYDPIQFLKATEKEIYLTYSHPLLGIEIVKMNEKLETVEKKTLNFPYQESFIKNNKLYVLSYIESKQNSGIIGVFNLGNYRKEAQLLIPKSQHNELPITGVEMISK